MKISTRIQITRLALALTFLLAFPSAALAYSPQPDLTAAGAIAALKADPNASRTYSETYNLGATGLRGWIYIDSDNASQQGLITAPSRQILVTVAAAPASAVLAVDDVILGAMAASTGTVPVFTSDCRKAFGVAVGNAEKTGAGTLRVKRWRAGVTTDVNIAMTIMGDYTSTAPYACPKSALILANARTKLVSQLLADPDFLTNSYGGAIKGLALLAGVAPGDADYAAVQTRLQSYARALTPANLTLGECSTWHWGYIGIFLSEYYLRSVADGVPDASVLSGINKYTVGLAKAQSKYGTFGHGGAEKHADGSLHGSISWYGPVNSAGTPANIAIIMGKKVLVASGGAVDPEIDPAIERGSNFLAYYVNKGMIPYGEHEPLSDSHSSNGKDPMCAVLFGLQANRQVETEYFARMSVAGCVGNQAGHTGQGFSYLWGAIGANVGGPTAIAKFMENLRWQMDLKRRTDGSFAYEGKEQYGGGSTADGTYLGASNYKEMNSTAVYVLSYSVPLQRLYITGRNAIPANTLSAAKVDNAIAAATFKQNVGGYTVPQLMTALSEYDPVVRFDVATELAKRTLTTTEVNTLIGYITNGTMSADPNVRMSASQTLGIRKTTAALPALTQRLSDSDLWVRGQAGKALKNFGGAASPQLTPMLTAFTANATDPNVIVWSDPIQIANGYLADTLFNNLSSYTIAAAKSLLYPAVRAGLKQPDGMARSYLGGFIESRLTFADVQAVTPSIIQAAAERSPSDQMFADFIRAAALRTLGKFKIEEGIPLCLQYKEQTWHGDDWTPFDLLQNTYRGAAKDALPTLYKWQAYLPQFAADGSIGPIGDRLANITSKIASTIAAIENDNAPPTLNYFKSLTATATPTAVTFPAATTTLGATMTDIDGGVQNVIWSKLSGPGTVTFSPAGFTANPAGSATFSLPGTYVLRARSVDRSILDYNRWITYNLGYVNFETYDQVLGAVIKDVTVTVSPDPNRPPVSQNQSLTTALNTAVPVTLTATDADGDTLTYTVVASPLHGALSGTSPNLLFTPTAGYTGLDSFTFKANDGKVNSAVATITLDIGMAGNRRPVATNQSATTLEEAVKPITLAGTDADGNALIYDLVSGPTHGVLFGTPPNLTYLPAGNYPANNFSGLDSFTFTVRDASLTSAVATVNITVTPVNDVPQATAQSVNASANVEKSILLAGSDAEIYPLTYNVVTYPAHGTLSGTAPNLSYLPDVDYHGPDNFTFKVTDVDGLISSIATVSITVINEAPVVDAQELEMQPNAAQAITLTGSDSTNDALNFSVITPPANGTLSGTAPNLTYTPTAAFTGTDSFTFKANDGANDSPSATVTIHVAQVQTWTNIASGTWSTGAKWSGGVAPTPGGSSTGTLVFNTGGYSGISSNDLAGTFLLNRVNFGSALPALSVSGNALSFALNSTTLPEINQDSAKTVTVSNNLNLAAGTTVGGSGAGSLTLSGIISGASSLTQASSGNLTLSGVNTYSGGTVVSRGTFTLGNKNACGTGAITLAAGTTFQQANFEGNAASLAVPNALVLSGTGHVTMNMPFAYKDVWLNQPVSGTGGFTVQGGSRALTLTGNNTFSGGVKLVNSDNKIQISHLNALGTGTFRTERSTSNFGQLIPLANLSAGSGVANAVDIANGSYLNVYANETNHLLLSGPITSAVGTGHLHKSGSATLTLSGVNTYTGTTTVAAGILSCSNATSLGGGPLAITGTAKLNVNFNGTCKATSLSLGGVAQANGTYGSTSSSAANKNDTWFSGTGMVTVVPVAPVTTTALALTAGNTPSYQGVPLTFTATVTGSTPTGNVSFYAGATLLGTSALNGAFQASVTTSSLAAGSYGITAQYAGNTNNASSTSAALTVQVNAVPAPPINLSATADSNRVSLTWSTTAAANDYRVKRSLTDGGPYTTISATYEAAFTDTSAVDGTTYYYVVSASNGSGESANSASASVTPFTPIFAKDILTFVFPGQPVTTISGTNINVTVPFGTNVSALAPSYTVSNGASGAPVSGTTRNFTSPQTYTITAADLSTQVYTVSVTGNQPPVATAQSVSLEINTAKSITLTATDSAGDALTYAIVTSPTNGTLTGTPPNVIYTPTNGYSGTDSFTFKANDGSIDSAAATVSLTVTPLTFTWNTAIAGNWNDGTKWATGTSPSSTGLVGYVLNFNATGTYTATHNLSAGFLLTQLNFGGSTVTLAGNSLALSANGTTLPQVNQNSSNAATISAPITLAANTILGGSGGGAVTLSGIISGGGTLTKTSSGNLTLSGVNTYTAGTTVNSGTLTLATQSGLGSGSLTLAAGTTFQQDLFEGNGSGGALPNALVLSGTGNVIMNMPFSGGKDVWLSQPVSGTGGFTVQGGSRSLTLTGNNTFSGGIKLTNTDNKIQISHLNALGTGVFRTERLTASSGQLIPLANLSGGAGVPNAFDIASGAYLNVFANATNHLLLTGPITSAVGTGNLHKSGTATLTLSGVNSYTGTTTVAAGVLACNSATALGQGPVAITSGAKLTLNFTGTRQVASLSLGGVSQGNGSYGSTASAAINKNDTYFTGTGTVSVGPIPTATSTTLTSSLGATAPYGSAVTFTATVAVMGGPATGTVTFKDGVTVLGTGTLSSGTATFATSTLAIGAHSITASYEGSVTFATSVSSVFGYSVTAAPGYETWATNGAQSLTLGVNDSPTADPDGDGISNLMEFALGGAPMASSAAILPTFTNPGAAWVFEYNRSDAAQSTTTQVVEYGNNLSGWTPVTIPASSAGMVEIAPGSPSDRVKVTIPNQGNQIFVRLKVSQ
jgi:autotransporter-associated beta strand protein